MLFPSAPSPLDLHFQLSGVPVRVQPGFWLVSLLFGISAGEDLSFLFLWTGALFLSILVHEMGHAACVIWFGGEPAVTLHGFGGYCAYQSVRRTPGSASLIALAGPAAGFCLAALVVLSLHLANRELYFSAYDLFRWRLGGDEPIENLNAERLVLALLYINIFWGLINLLPIWPLDGGRVSREIFNRLNATQGDRQSLWLSAIAAAAMSLWGLTRMQSPFTAVFFGLLAYESLRAAQGRGR